jgi:DNA ligase (NAD+)
MGLIKDIPGVYTLRQKKLRNMEGFGEKSITNLQQAIEKSKSQPLHRLIYALGIRYVGETTAKTLAQRVKVYTTWQIILLKNYRRWMMLV